MKVSILGAGTWGTALAYILSENNFNVLVWGRSEKKINALNITKKHPDLNNFSIPNNVNYTTKISDLDSDIVVVATPSIFIDQFLSLELYNKFKIIIFACKGFYEFDDNRIKNIYDKLVILSGPSHAEEVIQKKETAVLAASKNIDLSKDIQEMFSTSFFRVYHSNDIWGAYIGGGIKNIIAIAAGICDGLELGDNTKAALVSRGMSEIVNFSKNTSYNKHPINIDTLYGLSGLGDLVCTAYSNHSRNKKFGELIGRGNSSKDSLKKVGMIVEGFESAKIINSIIENHNISMPICKEIYKILYENKDPKLSLYNLMSRELTSET